MFACREAVRGYTQPLRPRQAAVAHAGTCSCVHMCASERAPNLPGAAAEGVLASGTVYASAGSGSATGLSIRDAASVAPTTAERNGASCAEDAAAPSPALAAGGVSSSPSCRAPPMRTSWWCVACDNEPRAAPRHDHKPWAPDTQVKPKKAPAYHSTAIARARTVPSLRKSRHTVMKRVHCPACMYRL